MSTATTAKIVRHFYATDYCCGGIYIRQFSSKAARDAWCQENSSRYSVSARQAMSTHTSAILSM